jgi:hypothetical protein
MRWVAACRAANRADRPGALTMQKTWILVSVLLAIAFGAGAAEEAAAI